MSRQRNFPELGPGVPVNIRVPDELLAIVDKRRESFKREHGVEISRSHFIVSMLVRHLYGKKKAA